MTQQGPHSKKPAQQKGNFDRDSEYRKGCDKNGCGRGYHGNRWDAHHLLPCETFTGLIQFIRDNLDASGYDINKPYSMAGLPKLTAFILYFQKPPPGVAALPFKKRSEKTVTMRRWGKVRQYDKDKHKPIAFPGEWPVHNPCNWGHTEYNTEVFDHLDGLIFDPMRQKAAKNPPEHFTPDQVKGMLESARDLFWTQLQTIPTEPGGGGIVGIEANLRERYGKAKNGWWKPLCMSRSAAKPTSPSLR